MGSASTAPVSRISEGDRAGLDRWRRSRDGLADGDRPVLARMQVPMTGPATGTADPRRVMVIHGRNPQARDAMFVFLGALGLEPIEFEQELAQTSTGSPDQREARRAAMGTAQAVVVLLTAEDEADIISPLLPDDDPREHALTGQPHPSACSAAQMALGADPDRTILVELGPIPRASDLAGLNVVHLSNEAGSRLALRARLRAAGCAVQGLYRWFDRQTGGDFDAAVLSDSTNLGAAESTVLPAVQRRHLQEAIVDLERTATTRRAALALAEQNEMARVGREYRASGTYTSRVHAHDRRQVQEHFARQRTRLDRELRVTRRHLEEELAALGPADADGAA